MTRYLILFAALVMVVGGISAASYQGGRKAGIEKTEAKYVPLLLAAERAKAAAEARTFGVDRAAAAITRTQEDAYVEQLKALEAAAADNRQRLAASLRQLAAARAGCGEVSRMAGSPAEPHAQSAVELRLDAIAESLAGIGRSCESDAATVARWQAWYTQQKVNWQESPPVETPQPP